jgi:hypothetical protein
MKLWELVKQYYVSIGDHYHVDPVIFPAIHLIATPLFAGAVWWIICNKKQGRSMVFLVVVSILIFNAANIYLVVKGRNIPFWIYGIVVISTLISGYMSIKKICSKLKTIRFTKKKARLIEFKSYENHQSIMWDNIVQRWTSFHFPGSTER